MIFARAARLGAAMLVAGIALGLPGSSAAQEARGTITGTVQDASKGVIPGATVTITNVAMGTNVTVVTNELGWFQAPYLIPGAYTVAVELSGFKKYAREVEVRVNDRLGLDIPLEVGASVETVTVVADTPLIETTNASLGQVVDARRILGAADAARRSLRAHRPRQRRVVHRLGAARPALRAHAHRRLLDGRHARQPERPDDRRRAEHGDGQRG